MGHRLRLLVVSIVMLLASTPSASAAEPNMLTLEFRTGGDDLRGGNDNVHVWVLLSDGSAIKFGNVNDLSRWNNGSIQNVMRVLPPQVTFANFVGVRLETTFSGGIGGDNWNLDGLRVSARVAGASRTLLARSGSPLVRFTGDVRVQDFRFGSAGIPRGTLVMTPFDPAVHGFHFANNFKNNFISGLDWTTEGLCGGMAYAALDFFVSRRSTPLQDWLPADGMPLQRYIYNRQTTSILSNLDKWAEYGFNPFGARNREFFNWGLQLGSGRLGELMASIDAGRPIPLGLEACGGDTCGCNGECPGRHQVLAVGYELGRYRGDLDSTTMTDVKIFVHDSNHPEEIVTMRADFGGANYFYDQYPTDRWRAYFTDTKYSSVLPGSYPDFPNELILELTTGGDDLRGGNDNVHAILLLRGGTELRFNNINGQQRWVNNSRQGVSRPLPASITRDQLVGIRLETTFAGGFSGDNWNLDQLRVRLRLGGTRPSQLFQGQGAPLVRFTGDLRSRTFMFP